MAGAPSPAPAGLIRCPWIRSQALGGPGSPGPAEICSWSHREGRPQGQAPELDGLWPARVQPRRLVPFPPAPAGRGPQAGVGRLNQWGGEWRGRAPSPAQEAREGSRPPGGGCGRPQWAPSGGWGIAGAGAGRTRLPGDAGAAPQRRMKPLILGKESWASGGWPVGIHGQDQRVGVGSPPAALLSSWVLLQAAKRGWVLRCLRARSSPVWGEQGGAVTGGQLEGQGRAGLRAEAGARGCVSVRDGPGGGLAGGTR